MPQDTEIINKVVDIHPKNWTKVPTVRELKQDQQDSHSIHSAQIAKVEAWLENLNVTGKAAPKIIKGQSSVQPKLIRKQAEWRYAALSEPFLSTDDVFNVSPVTHEDRDAAKQNQLLLNHQLNNKIKKTKFIDEYVRAAVDEGTVIVQTGWDFREEEYVEDVPDVQFVIDPTYTPELEELSALLENSPSEFAQLPEEVQEAFDLSIQEGQPVRPILTGTTKEVTKFRTIVNQPTLEVCNLRNIQIDPTAQGDVDKAGFMIKSYESSKSSLRKDGKKYVNIDSISASNNSPLSTPDHDPLVAAGSFNFTDDARKKFVVHQYWGKRVVDDTGIVTSFVAEWVGDVMIRLEENPFPDKELPFVIEHYLPVRKANYGEPDGELLIDNQKIAGAVMRGAIDIMGKSASGQTGMRKDMLDPINRRKFEEGKDYEYNAGVDPRVGVHTHVYPEIPNSAKFMIDLQNQEADAMTGVQSFSNGVSGSSLGDVAAGIRGALDAASKRELGILRRLSNGIVQVGRKIISMNAVFLSEEEVVRVTNQEFVTVRKDDLPGEFDLSLSISTAEEDNNKAEQIAFLLQTMGPNGDPEVVKMMLSDIFRLRKMPAMAQRIEDYQPEPDPIEQEARQLANELLKVEIDEIRAKTEKLRADTELSSAKVSTETSKAVNLDADTDQKNLDFVEQELGVKQERAKELSGEQAAANIERDIIKAALDERAENRKEPT